MRHFTCDLCGKDLSPGVDARYIVRMDISPAPDLVELTDEDLDQDQVEAMAELLQELEDTDASELLAPRPRQSLEYDLCHSCHGRFVADPLGRALTNKLSFSKN